ncbi:MAG TPA: hypothetical protein VLG38_02795, partial [Gammaproteobacteria bacterium]|nr:hypothetical protein [Gammaproteobacteria bacterium]
LGITDLEQNYYGHLDTSLALDALRASITQRVPYNKFFDFQLNGTKLMTPDIVLRPTAYWIGVITFSASCGLIILVIYIVLAFMHKKYTTYQRQDLALTEATEQIKSLRENIVVLKSANQTQFKYGVLTADGAQTSTTINLHQLLTDVRTVNAELAIARQIEMKFPSPDALALQIYGNRLRLMQILSGVLSEILQQLPTHSCVMLQVVVTNLTDNVQTVTFKFTDNGFYSSLQHKAEIQSSADVRAKGWSHIQSLLAQENGTLEHTHTAYSGNTIALSFTQQVVNNVIRLESYFEEA